MKMAKQLITEVNVANGSKRSMRRKFVGGMLEGSLIMYTVLAVG